MILYLHQEMKKLVTVIFLKFLKFFFKSSDIEIKYSSPARKCIQHGIVLAAILFPL